jgi:exonuclease III
MDKDSNILCLTLETDAGKCAIMSVYGPNENSKHFFLNLSDFLNKIGNIPVIIGGDWNATYSQAPARFNPDIINMVSPPSLIRSGWIADFCETFNLLDSFRAFYPTERDFTYSPSGNRKNRSRLDFFLMSERLLNSC